ncbi:hypothetical protein HOY80DRAFT_1061011 [Tuber brumale]|nr:hypothetical protein HOY80DRAFT_1061011 [Tuber brumale]
MRPLQLLCEHGHFLESQVVAVALKPNLADTPISNLANIPTSGEANTPMLDQYEASILDLADTAMPMTDVIDPLMVVE